MSGNYFKNVEKKWKKRIKIDSYQSIPDNRKKYFVTAPIPYVNGRFHIGHGYTYLRHDVIARFKRLQGYNVLFPFAFHATGEPILGVAERLKRGDKAQIRALETLGVSKEELKKFDNPTYIARYWQKRISEDIINFGISADNQRSFSTIDEEFKQFITWQYLRLKERGYVIQGTHPVVYCPYDESPTGDHDRLKGEGEYPVEFTLLKFKLGNEYLIAASLRPETVFGQTNLWIRKDIEYVKAKVNDETWIISEQAAAKLKNQAFGVEILSKIKGSELLGKNVIAPMIHKEIPILPAEFVDPNVGTGIVASVPSDSPYDYIALKDLNSKIKPVRIIETKQYGDFSAKTVVDWFKIKNQKEKQKLDEATSRVYKAGFHTGIMNKNCGKYKGMTVEKAKEKIKRDMIKSGTMHELSGEVICRCSTKCIVKIIENQWFLDFGNKKWKSKVKENLRNMEIIPDEARNQFEATIEWLKEKACARKSGLGTKLPWDKEWIVETLSDSTIYMAFYTIKKTISKYKIKPKQLTPEIFDYIFLNKKMPKTTIPKKVLEEMKMEFNYYYGVDMRGSAKELVPNHLTYYLFHHVAMWSDKKYWPKSIVVNGMVRVEGEKMSKSKGNFIVLDSAIKEHSADLMRVTLMDSVEGMADPNFSEKGISAWAKNLKSLQNAIRLDSKRLSTEFENIDRWFLSRFTKNAIEAMKHLERIETRSALYYGFYNMFRNYEFYRRRAGKINKGVYDQFVDFMAKFLSCFTPYFAQELWHTNSRKGFVHQQIFGKVDKKNIDEDIEDMYSLQSNVIADVNYVLNLIGKKPKEITIVISDSWKYPLFREVKRLISKRDKNVIKNSVKNAGNKSEAYKIAAALLKNPSRIPQRILNPKKEFEIITDSIEFFEKEFNSKIKIEKETESKHQKAKQAMPGKPAIIVA